MIHRTARMTGYKRWDVLVTGFPFADTFEVKRRPAVCIEAFQPFENIQLYWVLMVTSTQLKGWKGDCDIHNLEKAGLPIPSIIRTAKIACVDASMIEKKAGSLDLKTRNHVNEAIKSRLSFL